MRTAIRRVARIAYTTSETQSRTPCIRTFSSGRRLLSDQRQWSTPLAKRLAEAISTTGPIPVAAYMRQCLTDPEGGYYTSSSSQFGRQGDFVTSPEISQVFGELVGIWIVAEWMAQGRKKGVELLEVGPGKATLMDDVLRTIRNFKSLAENIETVYLVEASPELRKQQKEMLCGSNEMETTETGWRCKSKYGMDIVWCEDVRFVPRDPTKSPFIIAHEFFDALPIHVFESVKPPQPTSTITTSATEAPTPRPQSRLQPSNQWRELLVSAASPPLPKLTSQTASSLEKEKEPPPEFELIQSKGPTPHSLYLPEISQRYRALKPFPGSVIEISPESQAYAADFAVRIGGGVAPTPSPSAILADSPSASSPPKKTKFDKATPSGAALIIDYGPLSTIPANSLRGIRAHKRVSPLSSPGAVDLSVDVDFTALAEAAIDASPNVEVHGPVEQGFWLGSMGIAERAANLVRKAEKEGDEERGKDVVSSWKRLVERGGGGMGKIYKAMAIVPLGGGRRPVGFGGNVVG